MHINCHIRVKRSVVHYHCQMSVHLEMIMAYTFPSEIHTNSFRFLCSREQRRMHTVCPCAWRVCVCVGDCHARSCVFANNMHTTPSMVCAGSLLAYVFQLSSHIGPGAVIKLSKLNKSLVAVAMCRPVEEPVNRIGISRPPTYKVGWFVGLAMLAQASPIHDRGLCHGAEREWKITCIWRWHTAPDIFAHDATNAMENCCRAGPGRPRNMHIYSQFMWQQPATQTEKQTDDMPNATAFDN